MSLVIGVARPVEVMGALPHGWRVTAMVDAVGGSESIEGSARVLSLEGPAWVGGRRPRLVVSTQSAGTSADEADVPGDAQVQWASREQWPHPQWGDGFLHQGVRVEDDVALAHDVFLFRHGPTGIRVEFECELQSLFELEDDVAQILRVLSSGA